VATESRGDARDTRLLACWWLLQETQSFKIKQLQSQVHPSSDPCVDYIDVGQQKSLDLIVDVTSHLSRQRKERGLGTGPGIIT